MWKFFQTQGPSKKLLCKLYIAYKSFLKIIFFTHFTPIFFLEAATFVIKSLLHWVYSWNTSGARLVKRVYDSVFYLAKSLFIVKVLFTLLYRVYERRVRIWGFKNSQPLLRLQQHVIRRWNGNFVSFQNL